MVQVLIKFLEVATYITILVLFAYLFARAMDFITKRIRGY